VQDLRLESFQNFNVGGGRSAPELYTIGPDGLNFKLIADRKADNTGRFRCIRSSRILRFMLYLSFCKAVIHETGDARIVAFPQPVNTGF
jgi:hypothetical protein